jgi:hypothetical protein
LPPLSFLFFPELSLFSSPLLACWTDPGLLKLGAEIGCQGIDIDILGGEMTNRCPGISLVIWVQPIHSSRAVNAQAAAANKRHPNGFSLVPVVMK